MTGIYKVINIHKKINEKMNPIRKLIMEGESGIATAEASRNYLRRNGITYVPRAPEQQVSHMDRRGALLRDTV